MVKNGFSNHQVHLVLPVLLAHKILSTSEGRTESSCLSHLSIPSPTSASSLPATFLDPGHPQGSLWELLRQVSGYISPLFKHPPLAPPALRTQLGLFPMTYEALHDWPFPCPSPHSSPTFRSLTSYLGPCLSDVCSSAGNSLAPELCLAGTFSFWSELQCPHLTEVFSDHSTLVGPHPHPCCITLVCLHSTYCWVKQSYLLGYSFTDYPLEGQLR